MKKFLNNQWVVGIGCPIIVAALTAVYDFANKQKIFTTLWKIVSSVFRGIVGVLNLQFRLWWALVFVAVVVGILLLIARLKGPEFPSEPPFVEYTEDRIHGWKWSWDWEKKYDGKWGIENLFAHCPKCDTRMRHDTYEHNYRCPRCGHQEYISRSNISNDVKDVIYDNIDRKYFKKG